MTRKYTPYDKMMMGIQDETTRNKKEKIVRIMDFFEAGKSPRILHDVIDQVKPSRRKRRT